MRVRVTGGNSFHNQATQQLLGSIATHPAIMPCKTNPLGDAQWYQRKKGGYQN